jgi:integrase
MQTEWIAKRITTTKRRWNHAGKVRTAWAFRLHATGPGNEEHTIRRSGFATRGDAEAAARHALEALRTPPAPKPSVGTFFGLLGMYLETGTAHLRPLSVLAEKTDTATVRRVLGEDVPLTRLSVAAFDRFTARRKCEGVSLARLHRESGCFLRIVTWAEKRGWVRPGCMVGAKRVRLPQLAPKSIPRDAAAALLAAARGSTKTAVAIALFLGLRRAEILGLPWGCVDFAQAILRVESRDGFTTKSGKSRTLAIPAPLLAILRNQHNRTGGTAWVFPYKGDATRHRVSINADVRRACLRAGIKPVGLHALRHTCFTAMAFVGVPASAIQGAAGHCDLSVSQRYMVGAKASGNVAPLALANAFAMDAPAPDPKPSGPEPVASVVELVFERKAAEG